MLPNANQPSTTTGVTTNKSNDGKSNSYQVLNISNVNAQNEIVLNDEQLLGLIQCYPFLYNPHVKPFNDPDYNNYAWEQITKGFNRSYENLNRSVWYTTAELQERWNVLQPIVRSLSKITNMKSLPDSLRQTVIKMSVPMDETPTDAYKKPLTTSQNLILQSISMVKKLPLVHRRRLEAEMMELILNSELDSKATIKLGPTEQQTVEKEYYEFLKAAGIEEINMENLSSLNITDIENENINSTLTGNTVNSGTELLVPDLIKETEVKTEKPDYVERNMEDNLLQPLPSKSRWVPLSDWRYHVRNCRVRIKRASLEDEIPLARIKREKIGF